MLNDLGQLAFTSFLDGTSVGGNRIHAVLSGTPQNLVIQAREGEVAPSSDDGAVFSGFGAPSISGSGHITFFAFLNGSEVDDSNNRGLFAGTGGVLALLARRGNPVPGAGEADAVFGTFGTFVSNDAGDTTFVATLTGNDIDAQNNGSIWMQNEVGLELIIRGGDHAPGTPDGAAFERFGPMVLNSGGQLAFIAELFVPRQLERDGPVVGNPDGGVNRSNDTGLWATDLDGNLRLIAREGSPLELGPEDFRTIASLNFSGNTGNGDGGPSGFNDSGQLAFSASFTDGSSGVFVSQLAATSSPVGDFDNDGNVNANDIDFYAGNLGLPATGDLAPLDLDADNLVTLADHDLHIATLVETSNGQTGTLIGDINLDGSVDILNDAFALVGSLGGSSTGYADGDLNADQVVNVLGDAFRLVFNLGKTTGPE